MLRGINLVSVLSGLVLAACAPQQTAQQIRICDDSGCSMRDKTSVAIGSPAVRQQETASAAAIRYEGEPLQALQADAQKGDATAAQKLGLVHAYGLAGQPKKWDKALPLFEQAAAAGIADAQFQIAEWYRQQNKPSTQQSWLEKAAAGGSAEAAHSLGVMLFNGEGTGQDKQAAFDYLKKASEAGIADASYNLGLMKQRGSGTHANQFEALQYFRKAGEQGHLPSQSLLGKVYFYGLETQGRDLAESQKWLEMAAGQGDKEAAELLEVVRPLRSGELAAYDNLKVERERWRTWYHRAPLLYYRPAARYYYRYINVPYRYSAY